MEISRAEYRAIRKKLTKGARKLGFGWIAEDVASEAILVWLESKPKDKEIYTKFMVVNGLRRLFGRPEHAKDPDAYRAFEFEAPLDSISPPACPDPDGIPAQDFETMIKGLTPPERAIIVLCYRWGFCEHEVAQALGVTESRICQVRQGALAKLRLTAVSA